MFIYPVELINQIFLLHSLRHNLMYDYCKILTVFNALHSGVSWKRML